MITLIGVGGGVARLFNEKNTELSVLMRICDQWRPITLKNYQILIVMEMGFNQGIFNGRIH
jgi:hypothetical protein